jgi:DNA-binding MarR family transcriptional regulator
MAHRGLTVSLFFSWTLVSLLCCCFVTAAVLVLLCPVSSRMPPKRKRTGIVVGSSEAIPNKKIKPDEIEISFREQFIAIFEEPTYRNTGISNAALKQRFGPEDYLQLVPIINELTQESRLTMSKMDGELWYQLVDSQIATQFVGLDVSARMVYQVIEKAGDKGIWTKDIRMQTNIQQQALNKIFKALEGRRLIKPVKSVNAKSKKLYMLFSLTHGWCLVQ